MQSGVVATVALLASIAQDEAASPSRPTVRVIERGTGRVIEGATVHQLAHEIRIWDAWWFRLCGDDLLGDRGDPTAGAQAFTTMNTGEGATIVASTPELRGARVILDSSVTPSPFVDVEVGPRRSVDVIVVDAEGKPIAGVPVEFGRFLTDVPPRQHGDDADYDGKCEIWDPLGARKTTDERGRATLTDLELHGIDDLDVLRGHAAGPFCVRALVIGSARLCVPVDPDAPPSDPVELKLPAVTRIEAIVTLPDNRIVAVGGQALVVGKGRARFAPGHPRFVEFRGGRAELFPVEVDGPGQLEIATELLDHGELMATAVRISRTTPGIFGDDDYPRISSQLELPIQGEAPPSLTLTLPENWYTLDARLLWSDGSPVSDRDVEVLRTFVRRPEDDGKPEPVEPPERSELPPLRTDMEGRIHLLSHRPLEAGDFGLRFLVRSKEVIPLDRVAVPLEFGTDPWHIDLGDVSFTVTPERRP